MTKKELIAKIAEATGSTQKEALIALNAITKILADSVLSDQETIVLPGFGKFYQRTRAARRGVNPQTLKIQQFPATVGLGFKASKALAQK